MKNNILICGDPPTRSSGYGVQIQHLGRALSKRGCTVHYLSNCVTAPTQYGRSIIFPEMSFGLKNTFGHNMHKLVENMQIDTVIFMRDLWTIKSSEIQKLIDGGIKVAAYHIIDSLPAAWWNEEYLSLDMIHIACHEYLKYEIERLGHKAIYLPFVVDEAYKVVDRQESIDFLAKWGVEINDEDVWVTSVMANQGSGIDRKNLEGLIWAFTEARQTNPNLKLYLHTDPKGTRFGWDIVPMIENYGSKDGNNGIYFPDCESYNLGVYSPEYLAAWHNIADAHVNTARAGAFELPIAEAAACGTPPICSEYFVMGDHARMFNGTALPYTKWLKNEGTFWGEVDHDQLVNAFLNIRRPSNLQRAQRAEILDSLYRKENLEQNIGGLV